MVVLSVFVRISHRLGVFIFFFFYVDIIFHHCINLFLLSGAEQSALIGEITGSPQPRGHFGLRMDASWADIGFIIVTTVHIILCIPGLSNPSLNGEMPGSPQPPMKLRRELAPVWAEVVFMYIVATDFDHLQTLGGTYSDCTI